MILGDDGAAFDPVAAVHVAEAVNIGDPSMVDVDADHAVCADALSLTGRTSSNAPI